MNYINQTYFLFFGLDLLVKTIVTILFIYGFSYLYGKYIKKIDFSKLEKKESIKIITFSQNELSPNMYTNICFLSVIILLVCCVMTMITNTTIYDVFLEKTYSVKEFDIKETKEDLDYKLSYIVINEKNTDNDVQDLLFRLDNANSKFLHKAYITKNTKFIKSENEQNYVKIKDHYYTVKNTNKLNETGQSNSFQKVLSTIQDNKNKRDNDYEIIEFYYVE